MFQDLPKHGGRFKKTFDDVQVNDLKRYVTEIDKRFFGLTSNKCRHLAFEFAEKNNIPHPFKRETKVAGYDWLQSFLSECKISLRTPEATSIARAMGFNKVQVGLFFQNLKQVRAENNFPPFRQKPSTYVVPMASSC